MIGYFFFSDVVDFPSQLLSRYADEFVKEECVGHETRRVQDGDEVVDVAVDAVSDAGILDFHGKLKRGEKEVFRPTFAIIQFFQIFRAQSLNTNLLAVMQLCHVDLPDGGSGEGFFVKVGDFITPVVAQLSLECAFGLSPWHEVGPLSDAVENAL